MKSSRLIGLIPLTVCLGLISPVLAQDQSNTAWIGGCRSGGSVRGYKQLPGASARFACGSSVYVWNATPGAVLVQQGPTVAYVAAKHVLGAHLSGGEMHPLVRKFLQTIAQSLQSDGSSAIPARQQLVESCLATRGCRVEAWYQLAWTRIKQPSQVAEYPDSTLRLFADGIYYSAFVANPPLLFRGSPLPSLSSSVLVLDGAGLSLAIVDRSCYTLGMDGKWSAAGASAGQSAAAIH
jgi:hypothetical protein